MQYCLVCCRTSLVLGPTRSCRSHRSSRAQRPEATARFLIQSPIHPGGAVEREGLQLSDPASPPSTWPHSPAATALISVCDPSSNPGKHVRGVAHDSSSRGQSKVLLIDSRSEPWSAAERLSHRLLRAAQIKGLGDQPAGVCGWSMVLHRYRLQTAEVGDRDRRPAARDARGSLRVGPLAQNALVAEGWRVLRFTVVMLRDHLEVFVAAILGALH